MTSAIATSPEKRNLDEPKRYTLEEYLVREARSKHKHEFYNGEIKLMPGPSINHNRISHNLHVVLESALENYTKYFEIFGPEQKIYVRSTNRSFYPDAFVVCEKIEKLENENHLVILNPTAIIEIASKSTRNFDRTKKFDSYKTIPSFKEYVIIQQDFPEVETWFKTGDKSWEINSESELTKNITLRSLGIKLLMSKIYKKVEF